MSEKEQLICDFTTGICGPGGNEESAPQGFIDLSSLSTEQEEQEEEA